MKTVTITGLDKIRLNLKSAIMKNEKDLERGLYRAGMFLLKESKEIVPVQIGNLKASGQIKKKGSGYNTDVIIYYTADYAAYVHEVPNPPTAHGKDFNLKHSEEIARAGIFKSNINSERTSWKAIQKKGKAEGGMFPRGENQQYKFLENPARRNRTELLQIIASG
jgi:hypothetical protein